jgi:hypothetical protein
LADTVNVTEPFPLPVAPDAIAIHETLPAAVQLQPALVDTAMGVPAAAPAPMDWLVGLIEYVQPVACVTVNVCPAIVSVPFRTAPVLAATLNFTFPEPVSAAPEVTVIHVALLDADHAQPDVVDTPTCVPAPPAEPTDWFVGLIEKEHVVPAWFTVTTWSPIKRVPTRATLVFAAMETVTLPLPLPLAPETITSHGTALVAAHVHPAVVATAMGIPAPPAAPTTCDVGAADTEQFPA